MLQNKLITTVLQNHQLFKAEQKHLLPLRLVMIGLLSCSNEYGVFRWSPRQLKLKILPYTDVDFDKALEALIESGFIDQYTEQDKAYGCILPSTLLVNLV